MISSTKSKGCIPSIALVMGIVICIFACNETKQPEIKPKTDTVVIAYTPRGNDSMWALAKASYTIGKRWAWGDSAKSDGQFKMDTISWRVFILDTARDAKGKAIYDSTLKRWKPGGYWVELTEAQKQVNLIHILPKAK